ncbi:1007_t:CDS:2 [Ambispora leptoticha]|uniref:1007_t:CDS:1 n=1 Tax=Ambispora leptoticha TaxID=144679 RepID=A0A9N9F7P5_9GLOM|nr:1007_t:CDS:2 [Ambispora leptoticha]
MISLIKTLASFGITGCLEFLAVAILFYILIYYYNYFTRENPLPCPFPLPVVGSLYQNPGHMANWIQDLHKKHGDMFEIWVGSQRQIFLNNADLIAKTTLPSSKTAFVIRYSHDSGLEEWGDTTGISFNRVPWSWRYNRRLIFDAVNSLSFLNEFTRMMQQYFGGLETYWKEIGFDKPQDIQIWVNRFISDMLYLTTTGKNLNFMAKHFNSLSKDKKVDISTSDSEMIAKFTSNAFAFFVQHVGRDKEVAKKIQEEIDKVFPGDPNSEFSYEDFKQLEYIEAALNESMRLHSTAPIMFRTNNERTEVGGFSWKTDTQSKATSPDPASTTSPSTVVVVVSGVTSTIVTTPTNKNIPQLINDVNNLVSGVFTTIASTPTPTTPSIATSSTVKLISTAQAEAVNSADANPQNTQTTVVVVAGGSTPTSISNAYDSLGLSLSQFNELNEKGSIKYVNLARTRATTVYELTARIIRWSKPKISQKRSPRYRSYTIKAETESLAIPQVNTKNNEFSYVTNESG